MSNFKELADSRRKEYRKSFESEDLLDYVNDRLMSLERRRLNDILNNPSGRSFKNIFVLGAPRSGTTLLTQYLSQNFNLLYINNFVARFFKAPLTGISLYENITGKSLGIDIDFKSNFARTLGLGNIHEFGYFWRHHFNINSPFDINNKEEMVKGIESSLQHLEAINQYTQSSFVYKNIYGGYVLDEFCKKSKNTFWIYIHRNLLDACMSILNARKKHYQDINKWWSYVPFEYDSIKDLPVHEQIFWQVKHLQDYYQRCVNENSNWCIKVNYEDLITDQRGHLLKKISEKIGIEPVQLKRPFFVDTRSFERKLTKEQQKDREIFNSLKKSIAYDNGYAST